MPCFLGNIIKRTNTFSAHKSILQFGWYLLFLRSIPCSGSLKSFHDSELFLSKYQKITPLESGVKVIAFIAMMRPFRPPYKPSSEVCNKRIKRRRRFCLTISRQPGYELAFSQAGSGILLWWVSGCSSSGDHASRKLLLFGHPIGSD